MLTFPAYLSVSTISEVSCVVDKEGIKVVDQLNIVETLGIN